jgi:carbamoyl-phosphate synthase large subunit
MIISKYNDDFYRSGLTPLVNNFNTIEICDNKKKTYDYLIKAGIGVPKSFISIEESLQSLEQKKSLIVKPISGRGSNNIFHARSISELEAIVNYFNVMNIPLIIQEYIGNNKNEYTVGVISDKKGKVIQSIVMKRYLFSGASGYAKVCLFGDTNILCEHIAKEIKSTGPLNVQFRLNEKNEPLVFEINPRFSGSAPMRALAGFNELDMMIRNFYFNEEIQTASIKAGNQYYRVFQEIEIDADSSHGEIKKLL